MTHQESRQAATKAIQDRDVFGSLLNFLGALRGFSAGVLVLVFPIPLWVKIVLTLLFLATELYQLIAAVNRWLSQNRNTARMTQPQTGPEDNPVN